MQEYIKKMLGSGTMRQIISNDEMEDIMKIIKSLEYSGSLVKQSQMKQKNKKEDFSACY